MIVAVAKDQTADQVPRRQRDAAIEQVEDCPEDIRQRQLAQALVQIPAIGKAAAVKQPAG